VRLAALTLAALVLLVAPAGAGRAHRLRQPAAPLAHALTVDQAEWSLTPSKRAVAAGPVRIHVYNRGEDDHDLVVVDRRGRRHAVDVRTGTDAVLTADLAPGSYRLVCSLQAGTPQSHEAAGMAFTLRVQ
jgi:hypothetical protein